MDITSYLLGKKAGGGGTPVSLQDKEVTITENGESTVTPDSGYNGLRKVDITTNVPTGGGDPNKKAFQTATTTEMNNLSTMKENDLCVVYSDTHEAFVAPTSANTTFYFPKNVTLDEEITSADSVTMGGGFSGAVYSISPTSFVVQTKVFTSTTTVMEYSSTDGINYSRITNKDEVTISQAISVENDRSWLHPFMFVNRQKTYGGLYTYAPTEEWKSALGDTYGVTESDVNFYDYDGTLVCSYTKEEFANLTNLPANPTHAGLTAQGWNWDLTQAKNHVNTYGFVNIGQNYITDDGDTRIYVKLEEKGTPKIGVYINGSITIDWGDNTTPTVLQGASLSTDLIWTQHDYAEGGEYVIKITPESGTTFTFGAGYSAGSYIFTKGEQSFTDNLVYLGAVKKIELGTGFTMRTKSFAYCTQLETITMPMDVTLPQSCFEETRLLKAICFPKNISTFSGGETFCFKNSGVKIACINYGIKMIVYGMFNGCGRLETISIPASVTAIQQLAFGGTGVKIANVPKSATSISTQIFASCLELEKVVYGATSSDLTAPAKTFEGCPKLKTIEFISGVTAIPNYFANACVSLEEIILPNTVKQIGDNAFYNCVNLRKILLTTNITAIGQYAFYSCVSLGKVKYEAHISQVQNSLYTGCKNLKELWFDKNTSVAIMGNNALTNTPSDMKIIVPDDLYEEWIAATNWADIASQIVRASEYTE